MGSSVSKAWKKVTGSGGGSSSEKKATVVQDSSVGASAAEAEAEAEKAEVSEFGGVLSKGKKAKRGTELGGGNRTFGSDTLG